MSRIGRGPGAARRWGSVAAVTALLCAAPAVADRLPVRDVRVEPRALLERVNASAGVPYSGYAESAAALGFPDVPEVGRLVDLLGETTHLRVWYRDPGAWRVDTLSKTGERGTYAEGTATWLWDSGSYRAVRVVGEPRIRLPRAADMTPPELGRRLARLVTRADRVTAIPARRVAGRAAAGVRIEPGGVDTTIGHVELWADAATGLPLRVEVTPDGASRAAVASSFLELSLDAPSRERVAFVLPPGGGIDVTTSADLASRLDERLEVALPPSLAGLEKRATVARAAANYGNGFGIVAVVALPDGLARRVQRRLDGPFSIALSGTYGEAVAVSTPLLNGLVVVDALRGIGYAVSGAVPVSVLERVAADLVDG